MSKTGDVTAAAEAAAGHQSTAGTTATESGSTRRLPRLLAIALAGLTLAAVAVLLGWDIVPRAFPPRAHLILGAAPLTMIALAILSHRLSRPGRRSAIIQTLIVAGAFLFWSANQLFADRPSATLLNDLAIALFVFDGVLTIVA